LPYAGRERVAEAFRSFGNYRIAEKKEENNLKIDQSSKNVSQG
jgi:hypothetical protein